MNLCILGDCLEVLPTLEDDSADLILSDLPYGTTRNAWDSVIELEPLWTHLWRVAKPNAAIVLTAQTPFDKILGASQIDFLRYEWIWEKGNATGHLNAKKMPMKAHENILVFYKKLPVYNPQKTTGHERKVSTATHKRNSKLSTNYGSFGMTDYDSTERYPRSVQKFSMDKQKSKLHPTQKPVALFEYIIKTYTNPGALVVDVAAGSGTTAIAAINTDREFICIEKDPEWFEVMKQRVESHQ